MKNRVREFREEMGLTQEEFARKCPISRSYLSQIENGKRNLSVKKMKRIADLLGIDIKEVFFVHYSEQIHTHPDAENELEVKTYKKAGKSKSNYQPYTGSYLSPSLQLGPNKNQEVRL
mgnify:FL=1